MGYCEDAMKSNHRRNESNSQCCNAVESQLSLLGPASDLLAIYTTYVQDYGTSSRRYPDALACKTGRHQIQTRPLPFAPSFLDTEKIKWNAIDHSSLLTGIGNVLASPTSAAGACIDHQLALTKAS